MPSIDVTVPQGAWSADEKAQIAEKLTNCLAEVAAKSGKGDITQFIALRVIEASSGGYAQGGKVIS